MTRYEQGFMGKCAEYGVPLDVALSLMHKTADTNTIAGTNIDKGLAMTPGTAAWNATHPAMPNEVQTPVSSAPAAKAPAAANKSWWWNDMSKADRLAYLKQNNVDIKGFASMSPVERARHLRGIGAPPPGWDPAMQSANKRLADANRRGAALRSFKTEEGVPLDTEGISSMHNDLNGMVVRNNLAKQRDAEASKIRERMLVERNRSQMKGMVADSGFSGGSDPYGSMLRAQTSRGSRSARFPSVARNSFSEGGGVSGMTPRGRSRPAPAPAASGAAPGAGSNVNYLPGVGFGPHPWVMGGKVQRANEFNTVGKKHWFNQMTNKERLAYLRRNGMSVQDFHNLNPRARRILVDKWGQ